jgi:cell division initiation protein
MITAQDVREKTFEKSKFGGGYDMAQVDEFLEEIADELTNAQKESAVLRSKMKVLVEKIEEYRSNESALNQSILSAQKLAQQIEAEARQKADELISDAQRTADETIGSITAKKEFEEQRLAAAEAASAKFLDGIRAMCNAQLKNIDNISLRMPAPQKPAEPEEEPEEPEEAPEEPETEPEDDGTRPFTL